MCTGLEKRQVMFTSLREYQRLTILTQFINQVAIQRHVRDPIKHLRWRIHLCSHMSVSLTFYKCFNVSFYWVLASLFCNMKMNVCILVACFIVSATRRRRDIKIPFCLSAPVRKNLIK